MKRTIARENAFIILFEATFEHFSVPELIELAKELEQPKLNDFSMQLCSYYYNNNIAVDAEINKRLKAFTANRIPKVCLAVLRLAIAEMMYTPEDTDSIVINEAVELTKKYAGDEDYQFVNGLLGSYQREQANE